jgi:hypothetical protein
MFTIAASDLDPTDIVNPIRKLSTKLNSLSAMSKTSILTQRIVVSTVRASTHMSCPTTIWLSLSVLLPTFEPSELKARPDDEIAQRCGWLRSRLIEHLDEADFECCPRSASPFTIVAGAGFAGAVVAG